jgi:hypothetical protein
MEKYLEALRKLDTMLKDTLVIQKELIDKLKWAVDFFHEAVLDTNKNKFDDLVDKELIEQKIENEKIEDLDNDRTEKDYGEPLTLEEKESECDVKIP